MHERYGPVVRYSEKELSFVDAQAWHDIYGHHGGKSNFPRNPIWYLRAPNGAHTILSADNTDHARMRRLLSHAFSERALKAQEHLIQVYFDLLINRLKAKAADDGKPFNIVDWFHFTTFDIAGDLEFGESFNCLEDGKLHPWIEVMLSHFKRLVILGSILIVFPLLRPIAPWLIPKNVTRQRLERFQFAHDKVGTRLAKGDDQLRADFMTYVCRYNDEKGMSRQEIDATFEILVSASSETTATALTGILHYLLKNPRQFAKLRDEIRGAFKNNEDITIISAARLTYLTAVINEGLRLCPPTPTMLPRLVPKGGASVCGKWLPGGVSRSPNHPLISTSLANMNTTHRHPSVSPNGPCSGTLPISASQILSFPSAGCLNQPGPPPLLPPQQKGSPTSQKHSSPSPTDLATVLARG